MKRTMYQLAVSCLLCLLPMWVSAQDVKTVSGTVTDKQGVPIPGVKVQAYGTSVFSVTDLEGTFIMDVPDGTTKISASIAGMQTKVSQIEPDMKIVLSKETIWNAVPYSPKWLVCAEAAFPEPSLNKPSFGLMAGRVKKAGWYVKGLWSKSQATEIEYDAYWTTGKDSRSFASATGGVIVRLGSPVHLYAGAGYANRKIAWELSDGVWAVNKDLSYSGIAMDFGLLAKIGAVVVQGGLLANPTMDGTLFVGNFGIGVSF